MATLAEVLRQAGYVTPEGQVVGPRTTTAQTMGNYIRNIIPNAAQNLAQQRADIDAALTMGDQGIQIGDKEAFARQMEMVPSIAGMTKAVKNPISEVYQEAFKLEKRTGMRPNAGELEKIQKIRDMMAKEAPSRRQVIEKVVNYFDSSDPYLYHLTPQGADLASFAKSGIMPNTGISGKGAYMATTPESTQVYSKLGEGTLFRINKQGLVDRFGAYNYKTNPKGKLEFNPMDEEVMLRGSSVPPEFIEVQVGKEWFPITNYMKK